MNAQDTIHLANDLRDQGKTNEAINLLVPLTTHLDVRISAQAYDAMGLCYQGQRLLPEALDCYEKGLALAKNTTLYERIENLYRNIGMIYEIQGQFEQAESYFLESIEYGKKHDEYKDGQHASIGMTYSRLGKMYATQGDLKNAKKYFMLSRAAFTDSKHYRWVTRNKLQSTAYYIAASKFSTADRILHETIAEIIEINQVSWLPEAYMIAGDIKRLQGKETLAKLHYLQALHEIRNLDSGTMRKRYHDELASRLQPVLPNDESDGVWQHEGVVRYKVTNEKVEMKK